MLGTAGGIGRFKGEREPRGIQSKALQGCAAAEGGGKAQERGSSAVRSPHQTLCCTSLIHSADSPFVAWSTLRRSFNVSSSSTRSCSIIRTVLAEARNKKAGAGPPVRMGIQERGI